MRETRPRRKWQSLGAIFAGLLFIIVASALTDAVLHTLGVFPSWGEAVPDRLLAIAAGYRAMLSIAGCYLTARLAPDQPMRHALWLGVLGVGFSTAGAVATWNAGPAFSGKWYPIALILIALPCAWIGGRIYEGRTSS